MDGIAKLKAYYIQLSNYYAIISSILRYSLDHGRDTVDRVLLFYYVSCIRFVSKQIFNQFGDLQLDDLEAEKVIKELGNSLSIVMSKDGVFTHDEIYGLGDLVTNTESILTSNTASEHEGNRIINPSEFRRQV